MRWSVMYFVRCKHMNTCVCEWSSFLRLKHNSQRGKLRKRERKGGGKDIWDKNKPVAMNFQRSVLYVSLMQRGTVHILGGRVPLSLMQLYFNTNSPESLCVTSTRSYGHISEYSQRPGEEGLWTRDEISLSPPEWFIVSLATLILSLNPNIGLPNMTWQVSVCSYYIFPKSYHIAWITLEIVNVKRSLMLFKMTLAGERVAIGGLIHWTHLFHC